MGKLNAEATAAAALAFGIRIFNHKLTSGEGFFKINGAALHEDLAGFWHPNGEGGVVGVGDVHVVWVFILREVKGIAKAVAATTLNRNTQVGAGIFAS